MAVKGCWLAICRLMISKQPMWGDIRMTPCPLDSAAAKYSLPALPLTSLSVLA